MAVKLALLASSLVLSVARVSAPGSLPAADLQLGGVSAAAVQTASWRAAVGAEGPASTAAHVFWNGALWLTGLAAISTLRRSDAQRAGRVRVPVGYARGAHARLASERGL